MLKPYNLLEKVLVDIEEGIGKGVNSNYLAKKYALSERHLRKLFKFAFKQSLGGYIRSRKLAASLNDLLKTDSNILDIALNYGYDYDQSYLFAFKREFGITPGDLRKSGHIVRIKPPLHLFDENKMPDGLIFGPDIVMVPQFHCVGKLHRIPFRNASELVPIVTMEFQKNDRFKILNPVNSSVFYGIIQNYNFEENYYEYLTSLQVKDLKNLPQDFYGFSSDTSLRARFRYIGDHHYYDFNNNIVSGIYNKIQEYCSKDQANYSLQYFGIQFIKIDTRVYEGTSIGCQMEWFTPITEKK